MKGYNSQCTMRIAVLLASSLLLMMPLSARQAEPPTTAAFEVASIKQAVFSGGPDYVSGYMDGAGTCGTPKLNFSGNRISLSRVTLCGLIRVAYEVKAHQIFAMPEWMTKRDPSIFYELDARAEAGSIPTEAQARQMLKTLLTERFK